MTPMPARRTSAMGEFVPTTQSVAMTQMLVQRMIAILLPDAPLL